MGPAILISPPRAPRRLFSSLQKMPVYMPQGAFPSILLPKPVPATRRPRPFVPRPPAGPFPGPLGRFWQALPEDPQPPWFSAGPCTVNPARLLVWTTNRPCRPQLVRSTRERFCRGVVELEFLSSFGTRVHVLGLWTYGRLRLKA